MRRRSKFNSSGSKFAEYAIQVLGIIVGSLAADIGKLKAKKTKVPPQSLGEPVGRPRVGHPAESLANPRAWWSLLRDAVSGWMVHKVSSLGAALAFYSLFSIGPLTLIVIIIAGLIFGEEAVRGAVSQQLSHLLGDQGAKGVENMLAVAGRPAEGVFGTILGAGTLVFAAVGVVVQLKDALNTVWEVKPPESSGVWSFIRIYGISFAGVLSLGFLLLISLLITTALSAMGNLLAGLLPELALQTVSFIISFSMTTALFAMMFKWLPDIEIRWKEVLPGGLLTAALFEIGKLLIGLYIGKQGLESSFGAAASLVIVLIWVYYSAQLVLLGAEFTRAYAGRLRAKCKGEGSSGETWSY